MCHATVFHFTCSCTQEVRRYLCALPNEGCQKTLRDPPHQNLAGPCPDHRRSRRGRDGGGGVSASPSEYIHPAFRNDPPPILPSQPQPQLQPQRANVVANRPMRTRVAAAPPSSYAEQRGKRSTGSRSGSGSGGRYPTAMSATMRNPARDLKDMPAFHATSPNGRIQAHGNLRDVREVPHIPQLPPSPPSRRAIRRKASMSPLVSNAGVGKPRRASRSRASPSPISPLRAHNAGSYSEVRKAAHLQRQIEVRRRRELYEDCERLLASRRYTKDELLHHRLILQLPERERERLFLEHEARVRLRDPQADKRRKGWEEKYDEYRLQQKRKSRCNVM